MFNSKAQHLESVIDYSVSN